MFIKSKKGFHRHHIIPKHMGGTDDPSNIIYLTSEEHAEAHKILWEKHGFLEDFIAWKALEGSITKKTATTMAIINSNKTRFVSEETRQKIGAKSKNRKSKLGYVTSDKTKKKISESLKKTHKEKDLHKDRRYTYKFTFPSGKEEITSNINTFCKENPDVPNPQCIRAQHSRGKRKWTRGKYSGFIVEVIN